jgi:ribosomal protein S18 acetylase RimI-like enzyme
MPAAPIAIRPARVDEAAAIAAVHVRADEETYRPIFGAHFRAVDVAESLARWDAAFTAGDELLVAEDDGAIVGLAHASETWMSALYLLASHHRRGVGARLLAELCRRLAARGVTRIGFQAVADNAGAIAFYRAMGAEVVGRKREGEGEAAWDELLLALDIAAPPALRR